MFNFLAERRLKALLVQYEGAIRAQLLRLAPRLRAADIDDLTQEVRIRLWQVLKLEKNLQQPASYLKRVVLTATIDALRRAEVRGEKYEHVEWSVLGEGREALGEQGPSAVFEQLSEVQSLELKLQKLNPHVARALRLHVQGYNSEEIAELLDWTEAKARNVVYRAIQQLKDATEDGHE